MRPADYKLVINSYTGGKVTTFTAPHFVGFCRGNVIIGKLIVMEESKRQKQVAALLNEELNDIFRRLGFSVVGNGMISISSVKVTPDLLETRVYLSFFQIDDQQAMLKKIQDRNWEIKKELAARVGKQLRRMPELQYYIDDTLDYVYKMEDIFHKIHEQEKQPPASGDQQAG